jgi:tRNA A37 threonylcarbamoyltransferase TsaD
MAKIMCKERKCAMFCPEKQFLVDNAGMIGFLGEIMFKKGIFVKPEDAGKLDILPRERTDEVSVSWKQN